MNMDMLFLQPELDNTCYEYDNLITAAITKLYIFNILESPFTNWSYPVFH